MEATKGKYCPEQQYQYSPVIQYRDPLGDLQEWVCKELQKINSMMSDRASSSERKILGINKRLIGIQTRLDRGTSDVVAPETNKKNEWCGCSHGTESLTEASGTNEEPKKRTILEKKTAVGYDYKLLDDVEVENIEIKINGLDDLIKLGKMYVELQNKIDIPEESDKKIESVKQNPKAPYFELGGKKYPINLKLANDLVEPLTELRDMIGMEDIKNDIVPQIMYYLQYYEPVSRDMLHTVIQGKSGVGKTKFAKILASIYIALGKADGFMIATRSDLVGEYLGQTAKATYKTLCKAKGKVLFVDEAYSLGHKEGRDSYSKECIDTITQYIEAHREDLILIFAGYKDDLEACVFSVNSGLRRRFGFTYNIENYSGTELCNIFRFKVGEDKTGWMVDIDKHKCERYFQSKKHLFKFQGGDMERLFLSCRCIMAKENFGKRVNKKIDMKTLKKSVTDLEKHRKSADEEMLRHLYI
jgi:hypothetical protein